MNQVETPVGKSTSNAGSDEAEKTVEPMSSVDWREQPPTRWPVQDDDGGKRDPSDADAIDQRADERL